jgi:hypothetical protein
MLSQSATQSYVQGTHGLNLEMELLSVQVLVRCVTAPLSGFVFNGMGSGQ